MLYNNITSTSPPSTVLNCSVTTSIRLISSFSSLDDDENMHTIDARNSKSTIIQTTLSPSKWSANVQNVLFLVFLAIVL